jgi:hypothetical protein
MWLVWHSELAPQSIRNSGVEDTDPGIPIGYLPLRRQVAPPVDYAMIALPRISVKDMDFIINKAWPYPSVTEVAGVEHESRNIIVVTHSAIIPGILLPGKLAYRNHQNHRFEKLVQVDLENAISEGDCGSPVLEVSNGNLYGHIIMGVPDTKLAYIVQALDIFRDIKVRIGKPISIVTMKHIGEKESPARGYQQTRSGSKPKRLDSLSVSSVYSSRGSSFSQSSVGSFFKSTFPIVPMMDDHCLPGPDKLPCEFVGYSRCDRLFSLEDVDNWIEHIISDHLHGKLPTTAVCWFCDDYIFDSKEVGSRRQNFQNRMLHNRDHILFEGRSAHDMRPDYFLNRHLYDCQLISESMYRVIHSYSEVPVGTYIIAHDSVPPDRELRDLRQQFEYSNSHDEERRYRRHHARNGKSPQ